MPARRPTGEGGEPSLVAGSAGGVKVTSRPEMSLPFRRPQGIILTQAFVRIREEPTEFISTFGRGKGS